MGDPEIDAMSTVATALAELEDDARGRVVRWAAERYGISLNASATATRRDGGGVGDRGGGVKEEIHDNGATNEDVVYEHFADLFGKAQPRSDPEKALVAAYWLQAVQGQGTWQSAALQRELKNLGHVVSNITESLSRNIEKKPQLIVQLQKSGSSKQARKTYKVTHAGLTVVQGMLSGKGE